MRGLFVVVFALPLPAFAQEFVDHDGFAPVLEPAPNSMGGGAALLDYDGDGDQDVLVAHGHNGVFLYENEGGDDLRFTDVTAAAGLPDAMTAAVGGAAADLDRDGDPDLVVADYRKTWMFENVGGRFVDVTDEALPGLRWFPAMATFADVDGDGWTDVFLPGYTLTIDWPYHDCLPDMLLRNRGDGTFEDVAEAWGASDPGCTLIGLFSDYDRDGDPDLFTSNDFGMFLGANRLFRNDGLDAAGAVRFTDVSASSHADHRLYGMGLGTADVDGNGFPDYFGTSIGRAMLLLGGPDGTFEDGTETWGVETALADRDWRATWGCAFLDAENDGVPDLYVASGYLPSAIEIRAGIAEPNVLYAGLSPDPRAPDVAADWAIDARDENHGVAVGDVDGDGDEDVLTSSTGGDVHLYENDIAGPGITVRLHGTVSNPDALGAIVSLSCAGISREREVTVGGSFGSGHAATVTLPIAGCEGGGEVGLRWPSGLVEVVPTDGSPGVLERTEPAWLDADPEWLPADGASASVVRIVPNDASGAPLGPGHVLALEATEGSLGPVSDLGDGTYEATLVAGVAPGESALSVTIDGEPVPAHPRVRFFPAGGDRTTLHASAPAFVAADTVVRLTAVPRDAGGVLDGRGHAVTFDLDGATPVGGVVDQGDGRYGLSVKGDGGGPILAGVRVDGVPRGPAVAVPEIVDVDPVRTTVRLIPGWVPSSVRDEDLAAPGRHTYVTILVSPRDGRGDIEDDGLAFEYAITGDAGAVAFERIPRGGGASLRMFAKVLLDAGDATLTVDDVPIARTLRLETYDSDDELAAAVDTGKSRIGPYLESAYADGQDYAWIETQLRDEDGDSIPMSPAFSFASDAMTLVDELRYGDGEEGKARMRASLVPGRATIDVTYGGEPIGVATWVDLLPARPRDLENEHVRICLDDVARVATGLGNLHVEVAAYDDRGMRKGSGYPVRLWLDAIDSPIDYATPGAYLASYPVSDVPRLGSVAAALDGTDRGATLEVEFLAKGQTPSDPDRPLCADFAHGFVPPTPEPPDDAGPDAGTDAGPQPDAGSDAAPPGRWRPGGGGCACATTGDRGDGAGVLALFVAFTGTGRSRPRGIRRRARE